MQKIELEEYENLVKEKRVLIQELYDLDYEYRNLCLPGSPRLDGMPKCVNPTGNSIELTAERAEDLKILYEKKYALYLQMVQELDVRLLHIEYEINKKLTPLEKTVIRLKYLNAKPFGVVAVAINYSERQTKRICERAVKKLANAL